MLRSPEARNKLLQQRGNRDDLFHVERIVRKLKNMFSFIYWIVHKCLKKLSRYWEIFVSSGTKFVGKCTFFDVVHYRVQTTNVVEALGHTNKTRDIIKLRYTRSRPMREVSTIFRLFCYCPSGKKNFSSLSFSCPVSLSNTRELARSSFSSFALRAGSTRRAPLDTLYTLYLVLSSCRQIYMDTSEIWI